MKESDNLEKTPFDEMAQNCANGGDVFLTEKYLHSAENLSTEEKRQILITAYEKRARKHEKIAGEEKRLSKIHDGFFKYHVKEAEEDLKKVVELRKEKK